MVHPPGPAVGGSRGRRRWLREGPKRRRVRRFRANPDRAGGPALGRSPSRPRNTGPSRVTRIMVSCGEPSGDLYAGALVRALRARDPGIEAFGFGGEHLAEAGARLIG